MTEAARPFDQKNGRSVGTNDLIPREWPRPALFCASVLARRRPHSKKQIVRFQSANNAGRSGRDTDEERTHAGEQKQFVEDSAHRAHSLSRLQHSALPHGRNSGRGSSDLGRKLNNARCGK